MPHDRDTYTLTVIFHRSRTDDLDVARGTHPGEPPDLQLIYQLRDELQAACDESALGGSFQVLGPPLTIDGLPLFPEKKSRRTPGEGK